MFLGRLKFHSLLHALDNLGTPSRMLKKAVQQGRRRVETGGVPSGVR
jgi:hypothetical protein